MSADEASATTTAPAALDRSVIAGALAMSAARLVVGSTGNVSARNGQLVTITPTRRPYCELRPGDLVTVALDGSRVAGVRAASRELPLHLALYHARADATAVVHTHSPYATAWSLLGTPIEPTTEEVMYYATGPIRTAPHQPAASAALGHAAAETIGDSRAVLLEGHGVVAIGSSVTEAVDIAAAVEHQAHIAWLLRGASAAAPISSAPPQRG